MTPPAALGRPRRHFRTVDSTNAVARELATAGAAHGTLVTAEEQTAGRGRQGRSWSAPRGSGLLGSVVLREPPGLLPLRAGVAVAEVCGPGARLKWPNDVLLDGRKVAGILAEGRLGEGWAVLGIGVNVALRVADLPSELHGTAGTLGLAPEAVESVLAALLVALDVALAQPRDLLLDAYRARDALDGQPVEWDAGRGTAMGISEAGCLRVRRDDRVVELDSGEVHLR